MYFLCGENSGVSEFRRAGYESLFAYGVWVFANLVVSFSGFCGFGAPWFRRYIFSEIWDFMISELLISWFRCLWFRSYMISEVYGFEEIANRVF